jgi:AcrR family transcriptional regulator
VAPAGRRPGGPDTRAEILEAARKVFGDEGYERASVRGIARCAGVDPALVHHYFGDKAMLFVELLQLTRDPREGVEQMHAEGPVTGARIVRNFLSAWEDDGAPIELRGARFVTLTEAVASSRQAADALREFLTERIWSRVPEVPWNRALITSQLFGLAWNRYILRVEPIASATLEELAEHFGGIIDGLVQRAPDWPQPGKSRP